MKTLSTIAPGDIDLGFGDAGHPVLPVELQNGQSRLMADGRILTAGVNNNDELVMFRHLDDGSLDISYGEQGIARIALPDPRDTNWIRLFPLEDGSALVTGAMGIFSNRTVFAARVLPNGKLDTSFGEFGLCLLYLGSSTNSWGAALRNDGKLVLGVTSLGDRYLALLDNGHLDRSFGDNGLAPVGNGTVFGMVTLPNGGVVLGGASGAIAFIKQFLADGSPDSGFGENGLVQLNIPGGAVVENLLVQPDGRVVVVGAADVGFGKHTLIARLNTDGSMDSTFNGGEPKIMVFQGYEAYALSVALQTDNKIVTGGGSEGTHERANVVLMRFEADGRIDGGFGNNGQVMSDFGAFDKCSTLDIQDDGKLLVSGYSLAPANYLVTRYIG